MLGGCTGDQLTRTFGLDRQTPDEFTVTTRAPLSIPPDFSLPPPSPGASRPQEVSTQSAAEAALAPQTALGGTAGSDSAGQDALVRQAGPGAPAGIRHQVDQEVGLDRPRQGFADALIFWRPAAPSGTALDPVGESQRLRRDAALGQSPSHRQHADHPDDGAEKQLPSASSETLWCSHSHGQLTHSSELSNGL